MSYTTDLAIELMVTGTNAGTWGQVTNTNLVLLQQAIAGYQAISIAGGAQTTALVMTQSAVATARNAVIKLTGTITGNQIVTVPNGIEKTWIVSNGTTGAFTVTFKYASTGTGQTWSTTDKGIKILYADGSDIQVTDLSTLSGTVSSAQIADYAVNTAELATNAVTAIKITQSTITQAKLAANSVGANQIIQSTITQAKLAANSVGPNQLIATAVTAGSYTSASITVDADGRVTAASSGASAAGAYVLTLYKVGPASGTFTANPATSKLQIFAYAGGGYSFRQGAWGMYANVPISQPYAQPYSVGGPGTATTLGPAPTYFINLDAGPSVPDYTTAYTNGTYTAFIGGRNNPGTPTVVTNPFYSLDNYNNAKYSSFNKASTQYSPGPSGAVQVQPRYFASGGVVGSPWMEGARYADFTNEPGALIIFENIGS